MGIVFSLSHKQLLQRDELFSEGWFCLAPCCGIESLITGCLSAIRGAYLFAQRVGDRESEREREGERERERV